MRTFEEWLFGARFYLNWDRYSNWGGGFVAASEYNENSRLEEAIEDMEGGDPEMITAMEYLRERNQNREIWIASGSTPSEALKKVEDQMRDFHRRLP